MSSPRRHWQVGPAKVVVRASPRPTVPNVNHHELHSNIAPQQPTLDLTTIQQHELKESVEGLRQRLLQAEARISLQTQALSDAADAANRCEEAEKMVAILSHRCQAVEAELHVSQRQLDEMRGAVEGRDGAWAVHQSIEDELAQREANLEDAKAQFERQLGTLRAELRQSQEETAREQAKVGEAREQARRWREQLQESVDRERALDARCVSLASEVETLKANSRSITHQERVWKKERSALLREVDKNTTSAILRREELYFTRTNMLKEQLRLRQEFERRPLPEAERSDARSDAASSPRPQSARAANGSDSPRSPPRSPRTPSGGACGGSSRSRSEPAWGCDHNGVGASGMGVGVGTEHGRGGHAAVTAAPPPFPAPNAESPRQKMIRTPSHRPPSPPPSTFTLGLAPRSPRGLDQGSEFQEELVNEYRAAVRLARNAGVKPPPPAPPEMSNLEEVARRGGSVAEFVGVEPAPSIS